MMIEKAFLQGFGQNLELRHEEELVAVELENRGIRFQRFSEKKMLRRQVRIDQTSFVVGDIPGTQMALKILGVEVPEPNDYPSSLRHHLHRRVWKSTLGNVRNELYESRTGPIFVKPASRAKRFTGALIETPDELGYRAGGVSNREPVWVSDPVDWLSEWRVYVVDKNILGVDIYDGNPDRPIDLAVVKKAVSELVQGGDSWAAYALDFGVLGSGETALVEMNDAISIGAYQIDGSSYTDFVMARWCELLGFDNA